MGKSKGKPKFRKKGPGAADDGESGSEEEQARGVGGQNPNVGMLPPSSSEEDSDEEVAKAPKAKAGQPAHVGMLPPSDSETASEEESSDEEAPAARGPRMAVPDEPRKKKNDDAPDPEEIRKNLERLELIRKKREEDRIRRIKEEGWDRYAPESETNRRPGTLPKDHPSMQTQ